MKVVLLNDVKKVGRKGDVAEVANGYGLNFLIPQGLAVPATEQHLAKVNELKAQQQAEAAAYESTLKTIITNLEEKELSLAVKANEKGGLYETLSEKEVAAYLTEAAGVEVTENEVALLTPVKETGSHTVTIGNDITRKEFTLEVVASE